MKTKQKSKQTVHRQTTLKHFGDKPNNILYQIFNSFFSFSIFLCRFRACFVLGTNKNPLNNRIFEVDFCFYKYKHNEHAVKFAKN